MIITEKGQISTRTAYAANCKAQETVDMKPKQNGYSVNVLTL